MDYKSIFFLVVISAPALALDSFESVDYRRSSWSPKELVGSPLTTLLSVVAGSSSGLFLEVPQTTLGVEPETPELDPYRSERNEIERLQSQAALSVSDSMRLTLLHLLAQAFGWWDSSAEPKTAPSPQTSKQVYTLPGHGVKQALAGDAPTSPTGTVTSGTPVDASTSTAPQNTFKSTYVNARAQGSTLLPPRDDLNMTAQRKTVKKHHDASVLVLNQADWEKTCVDRDVHKVMVKLLLFESLRHVWKKERRSLPTEFVRALLQIIDSESQNPDHDGYTSLLKNLERLTFFTMPTNQLPWIRPSQQQ